MRYMAAMAFLFLSMLCISTAHREQQNDPLRQPWLFGSVVRMADNMGDYLFVVKRELPADLRYSLVRYPIINGSVVAEPAVIWAQFAFYEPNQPALRPNIVADIDMSSDNDAIHVVLARSIYPDVSTTIYRIDPNAPPLNLEVSSRPWSKPLAEHTLRNIEATCGIDRVRLVAGRHELRIFLTRAENECGEEEIRYNLATGEWTPPSWQPPAPPIQPSGSPPPDKKQEPSR